MAIQQLAHLQTKRQIIKCEPLTLFSSVFSTTPFRFNNTKTHNATSEGSLATINNPSVVHAQHQIAKQQLPHPRSTKRRTPEHQRAVASIDIIHYY
jgi:hypothetical protein